MTNKQLIEELKHLDPNEQAIVHVRTHTQKYAVAQETPFAVNGMGIWISLPSNMHTVERQEK